MSLRVRIRRTDAVLGVRHGRTARFVTGKTVTAAALVILMFAPVAAWANAGAASPTDSGTSPSSALGSSRPTRGTVPGSPTRVNATAGNAAVALTWNAPSSNGGSAITGYVITFSRGSRINLANVTSDTVKGLTNGVTYTFSVAAVNAVGTGSSTSSNSVTPVTTTTTTTTTVPTTTTTVPTTTTTEPTTTTTVPTTTTTVPTTSAPSSLVIPLYDTNSADWSSTCSALGSSNSFVVADIGNPGGPGTSANTSWSANFLDCDSTHVGVLGYVDSGYCQVPLATVESQINSWYAWYGGDGIEGIFVDEAASPYSPLKQSDCLSGTTSAVIYYQTISAYVHAEGVNQTVTLNYGANPVSGWALSSGIAAQNANILVVFEDPYSEYVNYANSGQPWSPSLWESSYSASHFSILIYDATNANLPGAFCSSVSQQNVGFAYATPSSGWTTPAPSGYLTGELNGC